MKKRLVSLVLVVTFALSMVACGTTTNKSSNAKDKGSAKSELQTAVDNLGNSDTNYVISNILEAPEGNTYYIENYATSGQSFTEYPVDSNGNLGVIEQTTTDENVDQDTSDKNAANQDYVITDWITDEGKMYLNNSKSSKKEEYFSLPDSYADICKSRNVMYMDTMLNDFSKVEKQEDTQELDLGDSDKVKLTMYNCVLPKDKVARYLAVGSIAMYNALDKDEESSENVKKLCQYYLKDLGETMYFSDANVYLGVDENKVLRTFSLEVGGLGSRLYLTKTVLYGVYQDEKEPDFSECKSYASSIEDLADYLAKSGKDYSTAINEMYQMGNKVNQIPDADLDKIVGTESSK